AACAEVGLALEPIVECRKLALVDAEGAGDQPVGKPHVLGQQWAVQVGADRVAPPGSLRAAAAVVAVAGENASERRLPGAEVGPSAMILKPREDAGTATATVGAEGHLDRDVADQTGGPLPHGARVEQPDAGDALIPERVGVPEQLIAAAHSEHDRVARRCRVQRLALGLEEVLRAQALIAVLAAA